MEIHQEDPSSVFRHNKVGISNNPYPMQALTVYQDYMMRTYPKGTRVSSSNLDPAVFWRQGVQMGKSQYLHDTSSIFFTASQDLALLCYRFSER